ncbi:hypothetical protein VIGAN_05228800 [Vigna angularis var. angularis]|uniref:Uncharacterized protein n=1 Tax=Vigna angularis var. angularis TaxID=157739 RepID=A0A0S3S7B3_PHAAN|nr:hypothetical protein VIGAN_05228800 [Vigna angularis var. angularis]
MNPRATRPREVVQRGRCDEGGSAGAVQRRRRHVKSRHQCKKDEREKHQCGTHLGPPVREKLRRDGERCA